MVRALRIDHPAGTTVSLADVPLGEWYPFFMQWQVPVVVSIAYTLLSFMFNPASSKLNVKQDGSLKPKKSIFTPMTMFICFHNAVLAVYSGWTFMTGWFGGLCDIDGSIWNSVLFTHMYLFYLAVARRYFRYTTTQGVIMIMYYANYYASSAAVFIVWENAWCPYSHQYLTSLQIFQFLFGQSFVVAYMCMSNCQTPDQQKWLYILTAYLLPLIYLFVQFFRSTYKRPAEKKKAQ
ncbi:hypothetical protein DL89DRAFT_294449 [Linderina pennispora]|uniref:Uncharacterized protein n=1 Tax=Linderina pennispora TaxID=61395 RepID=A0A1Y1W2X6_9FUNG|nr:uncharacterized protein DL89DRAFT_294449 [Linderina pennispora]ORX67911.1 hypothetical protein DL89DRAFT_294449 [Linderina pennispora]